MGKRKTHEEYVRQVAVINSDIEVVGIYIDSATKIAHRCKIDDEIFYAQPGEILRGRGCYKCGRRRIVAAKTKTHEWYISEINKRNLNVFPMEEYIKNKTKIEHVCKNCGYRWNITPNDVLDGCGCPVCAHKVIGPAPEYKNSIWASKYRELAIQYGMTEEQTKTIMPMSSAKILLYCQKCGARNYIAPNTLFQRGFNCSLCSDGRSFPNKFMYSVFTQLGIDFETEYNKAWSNGYKYDLCNESLSLIVENHGIQHYEDIKFSKNDTMTLKERQSIDLTKKYLAKENGIKNYIVIDCRYSTTEWIKRNIMESSLPVILRFTESDINWDECYKNATSSLVEAAANLWNDGFNINEISQKLKICDPTVRKYLNQGTISGLCNYVTGDGFKRYHNQRRLKEYD